MEQTFKSLSLKAEVPITKSLTMMSTSELISFLETGNPKIEHHDRISSVQRKIHRTFQANIFLNECLLANNPPKFTMIPKKVLQRVNWSKSTILTKRLEHTKRSIDANSQHLFELQNLLVKLISETFPGLPEKNQKSLLTLYETFVKYTEFQSDQKRNRKLEKLLSPVRSSNN